VKALGAADTTARADDLLSTRTERVCAVEAVQRRLRRSSFAQIPAIFFEGHAAGFVLSDGATRRTQRHTAGTLCCLGLRDHLDPSTGVLSLTAHFPLAEPAPPATTAGFWRNAWLQTDPSQLPTWLRACIQ